MSLENCETGEQRIGRLIEFFESFGVVRKDTAIMKIKVRQFVDFSYHIGYQLCLKGLATTEFSKCRIPYSLRGFQ